MDIPEGFWSGWASKDFAAWLRKTYPRPRVPTDRCVLYLFEVRFIDDEDERTHPEATPGFTYHECVNRFAEELVALVRCEVRPNEGKEARIEILFYYGPSAVERWNAIQEDNETNSGEPRWA